MKTTVNLQQLRAFVYMATTRKLKSVASVMDIRQPTVKFHLSRLEEMVGTPLFVTEGNRIRGLTEAGQMLLTYAEHVITLVEELEYRLENLHDSQEGRITLGATHTPATYLLPQLLADFKEKHKGVQLMLEVKPAHVLLEKVRNLEIDFAVLSYDTLMDSNIHTHRLTRDDLVLICHPDHVLAKKMVVELADVNLHPFIMHEPESTSRRIIDEWRQKHNVRMNIVMEVSATETMKEAVKKDIGLAIVSESSIREEIAANTLVAKELPDFTTDRYIYLVYHKHRFQNFIGREFRQTILKLFSQRLRSL